MKCYYYIKLPNGGELRFPATFSTLSSKDNKELRDLINKFKQAKTDAFNALQSYVKNNTGLSGQATVLINEIQVDHNLISDEDFEKFITNINDKVTAKGEYAELQKAISQVIFSKKGKIDYFNKNENWVSIKPEEAIQKLKNPVHIDYFGQVDFENIVGTLSYNDLHEENVIKTLELDSFGLNSNFPRNLDKLLGFAFPNKNYNRVQKTFFKTTFSSDSVMGKDDSIIIYDEHLRLPLIFVQENSQLSLNFAMLKVIAVSLFENKPDYLKEIIQMYNKKAHETNQIDVNIEIKEFFTGKVIDGIRSDPEFYKLYKFAYGEDALSLLASKMIELLPAQNEDLKNPIKNTIGLMSPKNLSSFNKLIEQKEFVKSSNKEQIVLFEKYQIKDILPLFEKDKRTSYYNIEEVIGPFESSIDLFNYLNYNIRKNLDLVKVSIENKKSGEVKNRYITPSVIKVYGDVVFIRGWYSQNGTPTSYSGVLDFKKSLSINKFHSSKKPDIYSSNMTEKLVRPIIIKIDSENKMPDSVIKSLIHRGSYVEYTYEKNEKDEKTGSIVRVEKKGKGTVKNVLPGEIQLNPVIFKDKSISFSPTMSSITLIHSNIEELGGFIYKEFAKLKDLTLSQEEELDKFLIGKSQLAIKSLQTWDSTTPISKGDWVSINAGKNSKGEDLVVHNMVVGKSKDTVYILIQTAKGSRIESIPKTKITNVFKPKVKFDNDKRREIGEFYSKVMEERSIRQHEYSMFYDANKLSDGDFAWSESKKILYTLINKESNEFINFSIKDGEESVEYSTSLPKDVVFITNKNIADDSYGVYIDFNNFDLITTDKLEEKQEEKMYLIPENMDVTIDNLLPSGNLNIGLVKDKDFVQNFEEDPTIYKDVTRQVIELINLRRKDITTGKGTKMLAIKHSEGGFYKRYDSNLYQVNYSKEYVKFLKDYAFISLRKKEIVNGKEKEVISHKYRIIANDGKKLILEYNVFNKFGKVITVSKTLDLETEGDNIKYLFVMKHNSDYAAVKKINEATKIKEEKLSKKEMFSGIITAFHRLYNIDVEVRSLEDGLKKTKKAYIQASSAGNKIVINKDLDGSEEEILHEYLHLFLSAAKYNNSNIYEKLLVNWLKVTGQSLENLNLIEAEELFVFEVSTRMTTNREYLLNIDMESFLELFSEILKQLKVIENDDNTFNPKNGTIQSVFHILNYKMSDISAFKSLGSSSKSRTNLLYYDLNFKEWMEKLTTGGDENNKLIINCE